MNKKIPREMVLFPTEDQFNQKSDELVIDECYWTIPMYPVRKEELIGTKIYFYDKAYNKIALRATVTGFDVDDPYEDRPKKTVLFEINDENEEDEDSAFELDLKDYEKRKQNRGFCYRWWK